MYNVTIVNKNVHCFNTIKSRHVLLKHRGTSLFLKSDLKSLQSVNISQTKPCFSIFIPKV